MKGKHLIYFLLASMLPSIVLAQSGPFTPVPGDKSMQILAAMFGQLGVFGASSSDAFATVIATFNSAVLIIGGILVAYTLFAGTLGTAHDGEMLGKKFSSVWVPIRTAMGTALILPVINGYCLMQLLVGWLIVQGVGLADNVWSAYMSSSNIAKTVSISLESPQVKSMAWGVFGNLACVRGYEQIYNETQRNHPTVYPAISWGTTSESVPGGTIIHFGSLQDRGGFFKNSCGSIFVAQTEPLSGGGTSEFDMLGDLSALNGDLSSADTAHLSSVNALVSSVDAAARTFVANPNSVGPIEAQVNAAAVAYSTSVKGAAAGIVSRLGDFRLLEDSATRDGWMLAGAWFMRMSYLQEVAQKAVGKTPELTPPSGSINTSFSDQYLANYVRPLKELQSKAKSAGEFGIASSPDQSKTASEGGEGALDWVRSGFSADYWLKKIFRSGYEKFTGNDTEHPILQMKRVGEWAGITAGALYVKYGAAMATIGTSQGTGVAIAIATLPIVMLVFPSLMAISFGLTFVLPMMPFFIWFGVFIGWVVLCVEALLAAPMWAVMHLHPSGDDMVGSGGQGYRLVLSLLLRPVLMIFGLIAALTMITIIGQMANKIFFDVFLLSQQDSSLIIMIVALIATPLLYFGFMWTVIKKIMSVIHIIPDQMLNWFGGGGAQLGQYSDMGNHGASTYMAVGSVGNMAGRALDSRRQQLDLGKQSEQVKLMDENNQMQKQRDKKDLTEKYGPAASDFSDYASGSHLGQKNTMAGVQATSDLSQAQKLVGGPEAPEWASLNRRLDEGIKDNLAKPPAEQESHKDILSSALNKTLNEKYGSGTGSVAAQIGGGQYSGAGFSNAIALYANKAQEWKGQGATDDQVKEAFTEFNKGALKDFADSPESQKNGGERNLASFLVERFNSVGSDNSPDQPVVEPPLPPQTNNGSNTQLPPQ